MCATFPAVARHYRMTWLLGGCQCTISMLVMPNAKTNKDAR